MFTNDTVIQKTINNVNYLQFKKLIELGINHCFVLNELDFSFKFQSLEDNQKSFKKVCEDFQFNYKNLCRPDQKHTNCVKIVKDVTGINIDEFAETDALITNKKDTPLAITSADCIPIIIYDPQNKVIANIHSGWKGTLENIVLKTVELMKKEFNSCINELLFFFGPAICQNCFEVQDDVKDLFYLKYNYLHNINDIIKKGRTIAGISKYNIDTILLNKTLLLDLNVPNDNMYFANICTCCNKDYIHSYRARTKEQFGLGVTIISL